MNKLIATLAAAFGLCAALLCTAPVFAQGANPDPVSGLIKVRSAYSMEETIARIRKDIADKGIMFFSAVDQSQLAAGAGIKLNPSTLLTFGNPPLGAQFLTSNPFSGLDWPVRVLVSARRQRRRLGRLHRLRLDRQAPRHSRPRTTVRDRVGRGAVDHVDDSRAVVACHPGESRDPLRDRSSGPRLSPG